MSTIRRPRKLYDEIMDLARSKPKFSSLEAEKLQNGAVRSCYALVESGELVIVEKGKSGRYTNKPTWFGLKQK